MISVDMLTPPGHGRTTSAGDDENSSVKVMVSCNPKIGNSHC